MSIQKSLLFDCDLFVMIWLQVLASNMIFLGVVIFTPFSLGRVILHYVSWLLSSATNPVLSTMMPFTESALSLANITLKNALTAVTNLSSEKSENLIDNVAEIVRANASELNMSPNNISSPLTSDVLKGVTAGTSKLSDVTTLAVGYMFIFSLIFLYFGMVALIRYTRGEPLTMGRFQSIASAAENIPSLLRQFFAGMRHLMTMIKVAFLLVIELGVFPLMCGWWLDICTIRMFGKSMAQRVEFFSVSPLASSLVHWVVGIFYMLQISIFVSLLRGVRYPFLEILCSIEVSLLISLIAFLFDRCCVVESCISFEIQLIPTTIHFAILLMIQFTNMPVESCFL